MDKQEMDTGTITVLMMRFSEYRLPRAKRLLKRVNSGQPLTDGDIRFLKRVYSDGIQVQPVIKRHPEYSQLVARAMGLYTEIIAKGLENEKKPVHQAGILVKEMHQALIKSGELK